MTDVIIALIVLVIVGAALLYIRREKKRGAVCIGCPAGNACGKKHSGGCSCHVDE